MPLLPVILHPKIIFREPPSPYPSDFRTWKIFEKFPAGSHLHDPMKKDVENMKEYVRNMKKYVGNVENMKEYVKNMKEYVGNMKEYVGK